MSARVLTLSLALTRCASAPIVGTTFQQPRNSERRSTGAMSLPGRGEGEGEGEGEG